MSAPASESTVVPSEVGWAFVPKYYTFVNQNPDRLHCFYSKTSSFTHGTEGDDAKACIGQREIHDKITSLGFTDCKVYIHSVDSQASSHGGIIIQVIGEMSNAGAAWKKFVQTFFLAEQPGGYFVLNDMFRFLKEDGVEDDEEGEVETLASDAAPATIINTPEPPIAQPEPIHEPIPTVVEPVPEPEPSPSIPQIVDTETAASVLVATPTPDPESQTSAPLASAPIAEPKSDLAPPAPAIIEPAPTPATAPPQAAAPPAPAPPPAPPVPKTWANMAAANSKKWGPAVATESRGVTEAIPQPPTSNGHANGNVNGAGGQYPALIAANNVTTPQCFIKGVLETVSQPALNQVLTSRFGPLASIDVVRSKACAFVEFASVSSAKAAIIASLSQNQGGEGGVFVPVEGGPSVRVIIETKKERGDRPPTRPRQQSGQQQQQQQQQQPQGGGPQNAGPRQNKQQNGNAQPSQQQGGGAPPQQQQQQQRTGGQGGNQRGRGGNSGGRGGRTQGNNNAARAQS